ncbi:universal stress protein [Streptomyces nigra]|uniref:universal stress protein n=1 Tax=Streptomyces nigra TaxID=1827580 RepID=UPI000D52A5F6|nr:universal stress protein [Streptomyces nigra]AWE53685.1 stress-inducible protein [Streptomyces nigra]
MTRTVTLCVTVGCDGSRASRAAAEWAAREARMLGLPLHLLHVRGSDHPTRTAWPCDTAGALAARHPGLAIRAEQFAGQPADVLADLARDAALLVLGSRAPGRVGGFLAGSVAHAVLARTERPVVLVREGTGHHDDTESRTPVVLGLDLAHPDARLIGFAFSAAARRGTTLRIVHDGDHRPEGEPPSAGPRPRTLRRALAPGEILRPWREKLPEVPVAEEDLCGTPGAHLVDLSREASLVVIGRQVRDGFGARLGPVAHAVLHRATAPVAVVPHV